MSERVTDLREPPIVGRFYMVPTVRYPWLWGLERDWPVYPTLHEDGRFFVLQWPHYHVDPRSLSAADWRRAENYHDMRSALETIQAQPPSSRDGCNPDRPLPHPPIVWRPRKCRVAQVEYSHLDRPEVQKIQGAYSGQQCRKLRSGWQCPHQKWPLGSVAPDADGVIVCPLHGLRIRAQDGAVLPLASRARPDVNASSRDEHNV